MKVIFSGGGTLGPVTPLLALSEIIKTKYPQTEFVWIGTQSGPERALVEKYNIRFITISSGKLRRYFSFWNFVDWIKIIVAFWQSMFLLLKEKPVAVITAGGFVSVPLHLAAWFCNIPAWVHQQDVRVSLANKIMAPFAQVITVAIKENLPAFSDKKTFWLGNPVRQDVFTGSKEEARKIFDLSANLPVVLATGGGTGSHRVNEIILKAAEHLSGKAQIIHITGPDRSQEMSEHAQKILNFYHARKFLTTEMKDAYAIADVVIARAGFGTLSELAALKKPAIIIPLPGHQEENAAYFAKAKAIVEVNQNEADPYKIAKIIQEFLENKELAQAIGERFYQVLPPASPENVLKVFGGLLL